MCETSTYCFRPVTLRDLPLLRRWRQSPHVREWWGNEDDDDADAAPDPRVSRWIVETGGKPFAYLQDYTVHGWDGHHFGHLPPGSRGIDQYIGEAGMIGAGHGTALIRQRMQVLFDAGAPAIGTDPHPDNARAIAVYRKLGFRVTGGPLETRWGIVLPMEAVNPGLE